MSPSTRTLLRVLPLFAMIAGHGYYKLWRRVGLDSLSGTGAFCAFLIVATTMKPPVTDTPGGFWDRSVTRMQYLLSGGRSLNRAELDEPERAAIADALASTRRFQGMVGRGEVDSSDVEASSRTPSRS